VAFGAGLAIERIAHAVAVDSFAASPGDHQDIESKESQFMPEIQHLIKIRAAEDKAYQALSNAEGIQNWWTRDATLNSQVGGAGEFGFYDHRMVITVKVTELVPTSRVAWGNVSSTGGAFDGTTISFDLTSDRDVVSLLFSHRGFKASGNNIASATTRWGFYLLSLKRYLETGKGTPNPDDAELIR
jgi:uncharacterized protein YndB with AHSA1/START domain